MLDELNPEQFSTTLVVVIDPSDSRRRFLSPRLVWRGVVFANGPTEAPPTTPRGRRRVAPAIRHAVVDAGDAGCGAKRGRSTSRRGFRCSRTPRRRPTLTRFFISLPQLGH